MIYQAKRGFQRERLPALSKWTYIPPFPDLSFYMLKKMYLKPSENKRCKYAFRARTED